ncbi:MAG TPA: HD domain-containing protein, partial [Bacteroidetes bacterium]|nr:HD domain-containing protein [Bacteroidota bacterium]HEX03626.1 HD domain-containing protein [Bacteroidota bacterium]
EMILAQARKVTNADGGTLYLVNPDRRFLDFHVVHNDTLKMHQGGNSGIPVDIPPIPLYASDGEPSHTNVSAHTAHTGSIVNIPDVYVYDEQQFDFRGARAFDKAMNYRGVSLLTVPMRDHTGKTIGVLQLINATDPKDKKVIEFDSTHERRVMSLASLAAVMLTQQKLIEEMKELFNSFIRALATSIDAKSTHTGNHIERVAELTMMIAHQVNAEKKGPFAKREFSPDEMEALRIATWLHDTGKITTPIHVVDKATRLQTVFDRIDLIHTRYQLMIEQAKRQALEKKLAHGAHTNGPSTIARQEIQLELDKTLSDLKEEFEFIQTMNNGDRFLDDGGRTRLKRIAGRLFECQEETLAALTPDEVENLSIPRGTLTSDERGVIEDHVVMTERILNEIAWPQNMRDVAKIAADHHEKLNGKGYPKGLKGSEIMLQSRIMTVADIFEALSAKDRPYKAPMTLSKAIQILRFMVKDGDLDADVVELFISSGLVFEYAERRLAPDQIDVKAPEASSPH